MRASQARTELERRKGQRDQVSSQIDETKDKIRKFTKRDKRISKAQLIIQTVAQQTQQQLEYHVSELVTLALSGVFPRPYRLNLDFELRRGKSEADLTFSPPGSDVKIDPINASGGGAVDVASLGLRMSMWSLKRPRTRPTFFLDEPFKNINDPGRKRGLHARAAEMLKEISRKLKVQMVVVTLTDELIEVADRVFDVSQRRGRSRVKVIG